MCEWFCNKFMMNLKVLTTFIRKEINHGVYSFRNSFYVVNNCFDEGENSYSCIFIFSLQSYKPKLFLYFM